MPKKSRIIKGFNVFTFVVLVTCGITFLSIQYPKWYPKLTEVSYEPITALNEDWELNATTTNFYPASWRLTEPKVIFLEKAFRLIILIKAKFNGYTFTPAFHQLSTSIYLVFPFAGNWTVYCNNQKFIVQVL